MTKSTIKRRKRINRVVKRYTWQAEARAERCKCSTQPSVAVDTIKEQKIIKGLRQRSRRRISGWSGKTDEPAETQRATKTRARTLNIREQNGQSDFTEWWEVPAFLELAKTGKVAIRSDHEQKQLPQTQDHVPRCSWNFENNLILINTSYCLVKTAPGLKRAGLGSSRLACPPGVVPSNFIIIF